MTSRPPASPISFRVSIVRLPQKGMPVIIDADEEQRAALAEAHGLTAVESFRAELLVEKWKARGIRVGGHVRAEIEQACIVTLEPVKATIDEPVEQLYLPSDSRLARIQGGAASEIVLDAEGPDLPEVLEGDSVDVGALAEEFFALAIDPYPRAPGAELPSAEEPTGDQSPFAVLGKLSRKP